MFDRCLGVGHKTRVYSLQKGTPWEIKVMIALWWNSEDFIRVTDSSVGEGLIRRRRANSKAAVQWLGPGKSTLTKATVLKTCHPGTLCSLQVAWKQMNSPNISTCLQFGCVWICPSNCWFPLYMGEGAFKNLPIFCCLIHVNFCLPLEALEEMFQFWGNAVIQRNMKYNTVQSLWVTDPWKTMNQEGWYSQDRVRVASP